MIRFLKRNIETAIKLPFALTWDVLSLGNMGDGASTTKVLREHQAKAEFDELIEVIEELKKVQR